MTSQKVYAHNVLTDVVKLVPAHYLDHPILGANLVKVRNGKTRGRLSEIIKDHDEDDELIRPFADDRITVTAEDDARAYDGFVASHKEDKED